MTQERPWRLTHGRLKEIFGGMDAVRAGVIGDFCLDGYWMADMRLSELSRETPHYPLPVVAERYAPGGAGNVAANMAALRPGRVAALGVTGEDWRGAVLRSALEGAGVGCAGLLSAKTLVTNAYIKPSRSGISDVVYEDPRIDFENRNPLADEVEARLLAQLARVEQSLDVLCVCDQMRHGCITPAVRQRLTALGRSGVKVIVDSRNNTHLYERVVIKPNALEALRAAAALGIAPQASCIPETDHQSLGKIAVALGRHTGQPVLVTLGAQGCLLAKGEEVWHQGAFDVQPPLDICGSGDAFLAAFACAWGSGAQMEEAMEVANYAASVTVCKVGMTGTASREEILNRQHENALRGGVLG